MSGDFFFGEDCSVLGNNDRRVIYEAWFSFILALSIFSYMFYSISTTKKDMWAAGIIISIVILLIYGFMMFFVGIATGSSLLLYVIFIIFLVIIFEASRILSKYGAIDEKKPPQKTHLASPRLLLLFFGFILVAVLFFAYRYADRWLKPKPAMPPAPPAALVTPPSPSPAETVSNPAKPAFPAPALKLPAIRLHLEATDLCWIQYTLDHQPTQEAQLQRGQTLDLKAEQEAQILLGNAGGLRVQYNDLWLKAIGPAGRPARLSFPLPAKKPSPPPPVKPSP